MVTGLGTLLLSLLMGLVLAAGYGLGMGERDRVTEQVGGQLSYVPGVLVLAALAVAVVGLWPRRSAFAWIAVAFVFAQVMLGETLRLPDWVDGVSLFWHLSEVPIESLEALPALIELGLVAGLVIVGLWGYRRRDLGAS